MGAMTRHLVVAAAALLLAAPPAHGSTTTDRLRSRIARLERSRAHYRQLLANYAHQLAIAREGAAGNIPAAVTSVAQQGRVSLLEQLIIEPLRNNWPCWTFVTVDPVRELELQLELRPRPVAGPPPPCYADDFDL
jgi:hypothetical protein